PAIPPGSMPIQSRAVVSCRSYVRLLNRGKGPASEIAMRMPSGECSHVTLKIRQRHLYSKEYKRLTLQSASRLSHPSPPHSSQMLAAVLRRVSPCDASRLLIKATAASPSLDSN